MKLITLISILFFSVTGLAYDYDPTIHPLLNKSYDVTSSSCTIDDKKSNDPGPFHRLRFMLFEGEDTIWYQKDNSYSPLSEYRYSGGQGVLKALETKDGFTYHKEEPLGEVTFRIEFRKLADGTYFFHRSYDYKAAHIACEYTLK